MKNQSRNFSGRSKAWDDHWRKSPDESSFTRNAESHPELVRTWTDLFSNYCGRAKTFRFIDIATGGGVVVRCAHDTCTGNIPSTSALDISGYAIEQLIERFPEVDGVVADAANIPFDSSSYDLVTSQFGVEYAGIPAVNEAARLVAVGGQLALILHSRPGWIYNECSISLKAIDRLRHSRFISLATDMFRAGFGALKGANSRRYERATHKFRGAFRVTEQLIAKYGTGVASGLVVRLRNDTEQMQQRLSNYDLADILVYLNDFEEELLAYRGRMKSMIQAAIDRRSFECIQANLAELGFSLTETKPLIDEKDDKQLAWWLLARRDCEPPAG